MASSVLSSIYPFSNPPTGSPYVLPGIGGAQAAGSPYANIQTLLNSGNVLNNIAFANALSQLQGPSFEGAYAAPGMDQLAQQYRQMQLGSAEGAAQRGLQYSGLIPTEQRGMSNIYSQGVLANQGQAAQQEDARKQALLRALLSISGQELSQLGQASGAQLQYGSAEQNARALQLQKIIDSITGGIQVASVIGGGIAGGLGSLGGAAGAASGSPGITAGTISPANAAASGLITNPTLASLAGGGLSGALTGAGLGNMLSSGLGGGIGGGGFTPNISSSMYGGPAYSTPGGSQYASFPGMSYSPGSLQTYPTLAGLRGL